MVIGAGVVVFSGNIAVVYGQPAEGPKDDVMRIETRVSYDQAAEGESADPSVEFLMNEGAMNIKPDKPVVKEDELIILNRTLRHLIEENDKIREEREELDRQLKSIRGQRAIEQNRINAMTIERDAYKQQTDQVLTLRERMEKDINEFRGKVGERESILKVRIAELEVQLKSAEEQMGPADSGEQTLSAEGTETNAGTVISDKKKSKALLQMVDTLNEKNDQLRADEARVRYNMGNIFFKQGEYRKAAREYEAAVELAPQDANAHYNFALVSGDYLYDHATAIKHYQQYLFLNSQADDYKAVKGKILEAELFLRNKVSSDLEKDMDANERRIIR